MRRFAPLINRDIPVCRKPLLIGGLVMIHSCTDVKNALLNCLESMSENPWLYSNKTNQFSRQRKISFTDAVLSTISMQRSSSKTEILKYYDFLPDAPSHSALIQQRSKLKPQAFEELFYHFTDALSPDSTLKGYRLFAVDGTDIYIPRNPKDTDTYRITDKYGKGFNMLHLNAAFDLKASLYTDIIIQPVNHINEYLALCDMIDHFSMSHPMEKALFIADRGFASFNVFAHAAENNAFFLIRAKDPGARSMLSKIELPSDPEFDITFERWLTRRNTKTVKAQPEVFKTVASRIFDYLEPKSQKIYYICFRIIRILLPDGSSEYLYTNLPKEDFSLSEIRDLYNLRWGIETAFRDIKYAAGMLFFHSRKKQLVLQEIYAKLILYNFSEAITSGIVLRKKSSRFVYRINFTRALSLCAEYLRRCRRGKPRIELDKLLSKDLIPERPERSSPRYIRARTAASFLYR